MGHPRFSSHVSFKSGFAIHLAKPQLLLGLGEEGPGLRPPQFLSCYCLLFLTLGFFLKDGFQE